MLYICLGNSDGGAQIRKVVATNLAARLRLKGGLLTGDKYRNRANKAPRHCRRSEFQGGRISSMAAVKFRDLPAHEIRIQCLVNWS